MVKFRIYDKKLKKFVQQSASDKVWGVRYNLGIWNYHVNEIYKTACKRIGIINALKMKVDRKSLETFYNSFVRPVMEYGDVVWDKPKVNDHTFDKLESLQLKAARIVTGATERCSTDRLYEETGWQTLAHRRKLHRLNLMYNIVQCRS